MTKAWINGDSRATVSRGHLEPGPPPQMSHCNQIHMTSWRARPRFTWAWLCSDVRGASSSLAYAKVQQTWTGLSCWEREGGGKVNVY